jgi:hypothetical protein
MDAARSRTSPSRLQLKPHDASLEYVGLDQADAAASSAMGGLHVQGGSESTSRSVLPGDGELHPRALGAAILGRAPPMPPRAPSGSRLPDDPARDGLVRTPARP